MSLTASPMQDPHASGCAAALRRLSGRTARRAMPLVALLGTLVAASASLAQATRPFQEKGSDASTFTGMVTPQRIGETFEFVAKKKGAKPLERYSDFYIFYASDGAELSALSGYSLLLLTVMTQRAEELPLRRVYIRTPERIILLAKLSSWRANVDPRGVSYRMFGPHREDGFYLFPAAAVFRIGQLQTDFAVNRMGLPVLDLPIEKLPDRVYNYREADPAPGAQPDLYALQAFVRKKTSGFPVPEELPQAAEIKTPPAGSLPQAEPRKPGSLKDLFKM
jgi:hypothetical protein